MAKWEIFKDKAGEFRAHLKASNGEIVVWTQGYTAKENAQKAINFVKANAKDALVSDLTR